MKTSWRHHCRPAACAIEHLEARTLLSAAAFYAAAGLSTPIHGKSIIAPALLELAESAPTHAHPAIREAGVTNSNGLVVAQGQVAVKIVANAAARAPELQQKLASVGFCQALIADNVLIGSLPIGSIGELARFDGIVSVRPARAAPPMAGTVDTQGDAALRATLARSEFAVDGTGVKVGVISDSFGQSSQGSVADEMASGDLPESDNLEILADTSPGTDEGRAMLQLIHDIAPGARLAFYSAAVATGAGAVVTDETIATAIDALVEAGCNVIVDDISSSDEPMYSAGTAAQAVDRAAAAGVAYFSAAANGGRVAYESAFEDSGVKFFIDGEDVGDAHDFDPGPEVDFRQSVAVKPDTFVDIEFQWDEPFRSVTGVPSRSDIDIYLVDAQTDEVVAFGGEYNSEDGSGDPFEEMQFFNDRTTSDFDIVIVNFRGPDPGRMKYAERHSGLVINEFDTQSSTLFGHANSMGGAAVGASAWYNTPAFGVSPPRLEDFSSAGGTPILFDNSGERLEDALNTPQPRFVSTDGGNTTFFGQDSLRDDDEFPNFFGTSAAAPEAAAVAALMRQLNPGATPADIFSALQRTAIDMDDPGVPGFQAGYDLASGFGLIQADAALRAVMPDTGVPSVQKVFVGSSAWTPLFRHGLVSAAEGEEDYGIEVEPGGPDRYLPWTNLDTVVLRFDRPVGPDTSNFRISDLSGHSIQPAVTQGKSPNDIILTVPAPIRNAAVRVQWRPSSDAPFENSAAFTVLPGDATGDRGAVNASDLVAVRNRIGRTAANPNSGNPTYGPFFDINGDGAINANDLVLVRNRIGTAIPVPVEAAPRRSRPISRDEDLIAGLL